ncbi:SusC/RagA family TonB-linked outer membrane protein [Coprobacter tertius]|uniref:TonB-dependent receptor n=1 Tax=Coprobacter tertius TaxID=2944915 RepID=A0ABT1MH53_9BACT|nr:TonB-dependent receptor [Coprobacter tertius]MCP9610988.1 TonB-dependent receptor [Coprobacter tertius]
MARLVYLIFLCLIPFGTMAQSKPQMYTLKGTVTDHSGEPITGATVKIKDTTTATITDVNGTFSMLVSEGATISASFIGYRTQDMKLKAGENNIKIVLSEDAQQLDEIVVVGYGTQKKSSLTSSIETIRGEDLLRMPAMNVDEALYGQVAGLQVRSSTGDPSSAKEADLRIRGINGTPLLVIDGVPRFGNNTSDGEMRLSDLNPDDVESISILKDAAAAAVYGARAANGVILVKTKRGSGDQKVRVNYRGQFNIQQATELPEFLDAYNFALLYNRAVESTQSENYKKYDDKQLEEIRNHTNPNVYGDENLLDYLNKYGYSTIHTLSVTGGNSFVKYYISGGYTNIKGLYSGIGRDRYNYAVKLDANLMKGLTLSVDVNGNISENKNTSYTTVDAAYSYSPLQTLRFTNGSLASLSGSNPLLAIDGLGGYIKNKTNLNTLTATLNYELPWVKGLSVYLKGTMDNNHSINKKFNKPETLYLYDSQTGEFSEDPLTIYPKAKISLNQRDQFIDNKLLEAGINYNRTFAEKHDVSGLLVVNYQDYKNSYLDATNNNLPGQYPEIIGTSTDSNLSGSEFYNQRASVIGRATYGYDNRYFIEGSFRVDGSTKFHPDNRWGFFPTVSGSWVVSNEKFFKGWNQPVISNLKLRASTGILGRDSGISDYGYLLNYMYTVNQGYNIGGSYKPGIVMDTGSYPNPDLSWEKSHDYNVAGDFGFWNNRFALTYEYYWRFRTDMITSAPTYLYPPSTGTDNSVPYENFGKIKAWGWDLTLTHRNSINKVRYDITVTLSKTQDRVLDYGDESSLEPNRRRKGKSSMVWSVYQADGLFQSWDEIANWPIDQDGAGNSTLAPGDIKYVDQNGDHAITENDRIYVKNSSYPDIAYSISLGVKYKGFFVNAMFQGVSGYQQKINDLYTLESGSLQRFQKYHLTDTWTEDNPNARYPRIKFASKTDNNRRESTLWIQDCNFVRLKSLSIGYGLPASILKKWKISNLSISLQGSNLFTLSSLDNMDPESLRGYPIQRSYGVTLNFGF